MFTHRQSLGKRLCELRKSRIELRYCATQSGRLMLFALELMASVKKFITAKGYMTRKPLLTYLNLCTEFYDLEDHPNHAQALVFYVRHAQQADGPILEPMCGTGRFLIPILQAGLDAEGFDASHSMLDALKQKYAALSSKTAPVWQQFVQDFESAKRYQLIFIPYGSWGLITDHVESNKALEALYRHLLPGGKFIVEIETTASVPHPCGVLRRGIHSRVDGSKIALNFVASYNPQSQIFQSHSRYESIIDNKVVAQEEETFEQYLYRVDELDLVLQEVGFTDVKKYPAFNAEQSVDNDTPTIIYESIK